jgi:mono/diheme cytochrome c family protein
MAAPLRHTVFAIVLVCAGVTAAGAEVPNDLPPLDLERVLHAKPGLAAEDVTVDDPVYKRTTRYRGYPLAVLLRRHYKDVERLASEGAELVFHASDGYSPSMDLAKALHGRGIIAFRDINRTETDPWETFLQGKERITPAPYYLVWPGVRPDDAAYKWPYQLVTIEIQSFEKRFGAAVPKSAGGGGDRARRGFVVFRDNCMGCHSVNLVGGDLAPELNVPKNVTEYWRPNDIRALIRDASSFRARSKMPAFPQLNGVEIDDLLHYLTAMKNQKICDARKPCPK